jgi:hypothetical protein
MKRRILSLVVSLLLLLAIVGLSGCIDKSKWRAKEHGGPPSWEEDFGRPERQMGF